MNFKRIYDKKLFSVTSLAGTVSLFSLLIPMMFEHLMLIVQGTINSAIISNTSELSAAAIGAVNPIISMLLIMTSALTLGSSVIISNRIGAGKLNGAKEASFAGFSVSICFSLIIIPVTYIFAPDIMAMQNLTGQIFSEAVVYFRIRAIFIFVQAITTFLLSVLRCYGYSNWTFFTGLISNVITIILNLLVVSLPGMTPIGVVAGIAISSVVGNIFGLCVALAVYLKKKIGMKLSKSPEDFLRTLGAVLRIGFPSAISSACSIPRSC